MLARCCWVACQYSLTIGFWNMPRTCPKNSSRLILPILSVEEKVGVEGVGEEVLATLLRRHGNLIEVQHLGQFGVVYGLAQQQGWTSRTRSGRSAPSSTKPCPRRRATRSAGADAAAMEMASQDEQLRAALFRLVDVTPACRSVGDLAAHLGAYLEEVPERPPALDAVLRASHTAAGRRALGVAATAGVRHMAHRFIAGDSPERRAGGAGAAVVPRRGQLGGPAGRGHGHPGRGRPLRRPLPRRDRGDVRGHRAAGRPASTWSATPAGRCRAPTCR